MIKCGDALSDSFTNADDRWTTAALRSLLGPSIRVVTETSDAEATYIRVHAQDGLTEHRVAHTKVRAGIRALLARSLGCRL